MADAIVVEHVRGSRAGERQVLPVSDRVRFGRHPASEVVFDAHRDLDASAHHAELRREGGGWVLVDVGSSNGTFVDGKPVTRALIPTGETVDVGFGEDGPRLRLYIGDPARQVIVPDTLMSRSSGANPALADTIESSARPAPAAPRRSRSTAYVRHVVAEALSHSTRRFKIIVAAVIVVAAAAVVGLVVWNLRLSRGSGATSPPSADPGEPGPRIVRQNRDALFLLAARDASGETPLCTAFAVAARHLATNAHCAVEIATARAAGREVVAVQNGEPAVRLAIVGVTRHPDFSPGPRPSVDVALLEVDRELATRVQLADDAALRALEPGAAMFTYGFPGRLANPAAPEATLTQGTVGRVTRLDERRGTFAENLLVQHSAFAEHGTSGSPVFDVRGRVIAVNTGAYLGDRAEALSGYNVAIRVDTVSALLAHSGVTVDQGPP